MTLTDADAIRWREEIASLRAEIAAGRMTLAQAAISMNRCSAGRTYREAVEALRGDPTNGLE